MPLRVHMPAGRAGMFRLVWPGVPADTGRVRQVLCPVLVGRDEEARHLQAALGAAQAGHGGMVFVTGEAGIGKSRLVRGTAHAAGARGFAVLTGRAVAGGVPTPFRPFAEALVSAGRAGRLPGRGEGCSRWSLWFVGRTHLRSRAGGRRRARLDDGTCLRRRPGRRRPGARHRE
jgi:hypothetical protein